MSERWVHACHAMCRNQIISLSVGLSLPPAFRQDLLLFITVYSKLLAHKLLGLLPSHLGSTGIKEVHFMWLYVVLEI